MRLRLRFSPFESRVVSLVVLRAAACAVAARRASGRMTTPLRSQEMTSTSAGSPAARLRSL